MSNYAISRYIVATYLSLYCCTVYLLLAVVLVWKSPCLYGDHAYLYTCMVMQVGRCTYVHTSAQVSVQICITTHIFTCALLCIHVSVYLPACLSIRPSSIRLSICPSVHPSIYLAESNRLPNYLWRGTRFDPSVHMYTHMSLYTHIHTHVYIHAYMHTYTYG